LSQVSDNIDALENEINTIRKLLQTSDDPKLTESERKEYFDRLKRCHRQHKDAIRRQRCLQLSTLQLLPTNELVVCYKPWDPAEKGVALHLAKFFPENCEDDEIQYFLDAIDRPDRLAIVLVYRSDDDENESTRADSKPIEYVTNRLEKRRASLASLERLYEQVSNPATPETAIPPEKWELPVNRRAQFVPFILETSKIDKFLEGTARTRTTFRAVQYSEYDEDEASSVPQEPSSEASEGVGGVQESPVKVEQTYPEPEEGTNSNADDDGSALEKGQE
jgi:hypothetical protein